MQQGDGRRCARRRLLADLRARQLRGNRRAGGSRIDRRPLRRHLHDAHAKRRTRAGRSRRRDDRDLAPLGRAGGDLPPESRRAGRTGRRWTTRSSHIEAARREGVRITTDMYAYPAGAQGSTRPCRPGCRRAGTPPGFSDCATRRSGSALRPRCAPRKPTGKT